MSFAIDVNVLLYASDSTSSLANQAIRFLQGCGSRRELFCVAWPTLMSYLRLATHPAVFRSPLSPEQAEGNVEELIRLPHARVLSEEAGFWDVYRQVTRGLAVRGNLVPDAHVAAILRQHDVGTLYTNDRDFSRFPFLRVRNPFEEG